MKLKEVIVEGIGDAIRSGIYRATGYGGNPANQSATKVKFINDLKQKLNSIKIVLADQEFLLIPTST